MTEKAENDKLSDEAENVRAQVKIAEANALNAVSQNIGCTVIVVVIAILSVLGGPIGHWISGNCQ